MSAHTPGPWIRDGMSVIADHGTRRTRRTIADCFFGRKSQSAEDTANAYLVSAAPDMLAALEELVEPACPDGSCHKGICSEEQCNRCSSHARARAAIAK